MNTVEIYSLFTVTIACVTQLAKIQPQLPVTGKNAKITALALSFVAAMIAAFSQGSLNVEHVGQIVEATTALSVASIGLYEAVKSGLKTAQDTLDKIDHRK